jgi:hypothetical protein
VRVRGRESVRIQKWFSLLSAELTAVSMKADKELMSTHPTSCSLRVGGRAYRSTLSSFKVNQAILLRNFMLLTTGKPQVWKSSYYLPEALPDALSEKKAFPYKC